MAGMKDLLFREQDPKTLEEIAELLGGEVDGKYILCPSPGRPPEDRSCCVSVNPERPGDVFIYYCEGPDGAAYRRVRAALGNLVSAPTADRSELVKRLWRDTVSANNSPVERYLRSRQITVPIPAALRFHGCLKHPSGTWPAMVAVVSSLTDDVRAIHRTFLTAGGAKAPVRPVKMTLGPIGTGAIRLCPVASKLIIAEGIETALSVMQASGIGAWSAISAVGLRTIELPPEVKHVIIAADGDDAGERAAQYAAWRLRKQGRIVEIAQAPRGKDFNDLLMEGASWTPS